MLIRMGTEKSLFDLKSRLKRLRVVNLQIVATELPYDVNKSKLIQRLDDIRLQRKLEGISEVRDVIGP